MSISGTGVTYEDSFDGNSTIPTPLGEGNSFIFEGASAGRYVRMTGINSDTKWLSVCEVGVSEGFKRDETVLINRAVSRVSFCGNSHRFASYISVQCSRVGPCRHMGYRVLDRMSAVVW